MRVANGGRRKLGERDILRWQSRQNFETLGNERLSRGDSVTSQKPSGAEVRKPVLQFHSARNSLCRLREYSSPLPLNRLTFGAAVLHWPSKVLDGFTEIRTNASEAELFVKAVE